MLLSKSKYLSGLKCPLYLWTQINRPQDIPETDEETQYRFDEGYRLGDLGKTLFPEGISIQTEDFSKNLEQSRLLLTSNDRKPLFEAAFKVPFGKGEIYARADILVPVGKDEWDLIEVKSATSVKDEYYQDVGFQRFVYEKAGLKIRKCYLMHANKEYVRKGDIDAKKMFVKVDITDEANGAMNGIEERINGMFEVISQKNPPIVKIGPFCEDPYSCPLMDKCWKEIPENSVFDLYWAGKKAFELFERGIVSISEIPEDYHLNEKQRVQKQAEKTGKPYADRSALKNFLKGLKYPLYFLDFETYATVIPLYDGLKPHQAIPFQFSLHIVEGGGKTKHISFIAEGSDDPREKVIKKLKDSIGKKGSIIAYNSGFEERALTGIAESFPKHSRWVAQIKKRIIDLYLPFRSFFYYHPNQKGSTSLKDVLPAMTGKSYENLEIKEGTSASVLYFYITHGSKYGLKPSAEEIKKIRKDLEEYCGLDTEGMIWIVEKLKDIVK